MGSLIVLGLGNILLSDDGAGLHAAQTLIQRLPEASGGVEAIDWKLVTNLFVSSRTEAMEKLDWCALRWKVEVFHRIMKSGCRAEESKLRTAERWGNVIATFCIMSWRIFWMTMFNRVVVDPCSRFAITPVEIGRLDGLVKDKDTR